MEIRGLQCCGVREIADLSANARRPMRNLEEFCRWHGRRAQDRRGRLNQRLTFNSNAPFFIFTQATENEGDRSYGDAFEDLIHKLGLGTVTRTAPQINPNSYNWVTVYTWEVNWDAVEVWYNARVKAQRLKLRRAA